MSKREAFEHFLAEFYEVAVLVLWSAHVNLPEHKWLMRTVDDDNSQRYMFLRYGLDQAKPIPDLEITDEGIRATLSFGNTPIKTFVPWDAVAGIQGDGERPKQRAQLRSV